MSYAKVEGEILDYFPCQYGSSKLLFRGPKRSLSSEYVAYLGGIETYGKFIDCPYPMLTEFESGIKSVNLGCANVGVDAYLTDPTLVSLAMDAQATVIQIIGAQNMSNRFYAVHPRRNDRFLRASSMLSGLYSEVDFTEFSFTRHLLTSLAQADADKFKIVENELKEAWVARMKALIEQIGGHIVLLWLADHAPGESAEDTDPMFIDRTMIDRVSANVSAIVEVVATEDERRKGMNELFYGQMELAAAEEMMGPIAHQRVADTLSPVLKKLVKKDELK